MPCKGLAIQARELSFPGELSEGFSYRLLKDPHTHRFVKRVQGQRKEPLGWFAEAHADGKWVMRRIGSSEYLVPMFWSGFPKAQSFRCFGSPSFDAKSGQLCDMLIMPMGGNGARVVRGG